MHAKCVEKENELFEQMLKKVVVSWTAMIVGYAHNGYARKALTLFHQMLQENIIPNSTSITSAISAIKKPKNPKRVPKTKFKINGL